VLAGLVLKPEGERFGHVEDGVRAHAEPWPNSEIEHEER